MPWTVARTEPQRESVARRHLGMAGYDTYLPCIRATTRAHNGHAPAPPVGRLTPLFSSYIFVHVRDRWYPIQHTIGIVQLLMAGDQPASVSDAIITDLRARERDGLVQLPPPPSLRRGDRIRIISGPFQGRLGIYEGMKAHQRVDVLLALFASEHRVELSRRDIVRTGVDGP